jgi:DNA-directed RNA polymerase specialized sigma24 family protein
MNTAINTVPAATDTADRAPVWEGEFEIIATKLAKSNAWRFQGDMGVEDLIQEFALRYIHCLEKYPNLSATSHFSALYRTSCKNKVMDLLRSKSLRSGVTYMTIGGEFDSEEEAAMGMEAPEAPHPSPVDEAILNETLEAAPLEVQMILKAGEDGKLTGNKHGGLWNNDVLQRITGTLGDVKGRFHEWVEDSLLAV